MQVARSFLRNEKAVIAACVFALAFLIRAYFAYQWQHTPYGDVPLLDARAYDDWAMSILGGHFLRDRAFYQSPLYPYLLAAFYKIVGHNYFAASLLNAALDSATAALLALISFNLFGRAAAIITGILATLYAPMIFYTAPVMKEPLALLLLTLFLFMALRVLRTNQKRDYMLAGIVFGLAVLARGNVLLLAPLLPIFAWHYFWRGAVRGITLFVLMFGLALTPATIHNYIVSRDFIPVTYADGFNLYIGHSHYANGTNAYPPEISTDPVQEELNTSWVASHDAGHDLSPSQVSGYWRTKALSFAWDNPAREAVLLCLKLFALWNSADSFDNYDVKFIKQNFPTILNLPLFGFGLVAALAIFTMLSGRKNPFLLGCIGIYMLSVVLFYVTDRYRLPVVVFLLPLAGTAVPCAMSMWRRQDWKHLGISLGGALLFLLLAIHAPINPVDLTAFDWGTLTAIYADKGQGDDARSAFEKGRAISETGVGVQAYIRASEMYEKKGMMDEAMALVARAVELFPNDGIALYNLARQDLLRGDMGAALITLQSARDRAPTYGLIYYAFVRIYRQLGDKVRAEKALQDGLAINPADPRLLALTAGNGD